MAKTTRVRIPAPDEFSVRTKKKSEEYVNRPLEERGSEVGVPRTTAEIIRDLQDATADLETTANASGRARLKHIIAESEAKLAGRDLTSHINTMHLALLDAQAARAATTNELALAQARGANDQEIEGIEQKYAAADAHLRATTKTAARLTRLQKNLDSQLESGVRVSPVSKEPPENLPVAPDDAAPIPLEVRKIADTDLIPDITPRRQQKKAKIPPPPSSKKRTPPPLPPEVIHEVTDADIIEETPVETPPTEPLQETPASPETAPASPPPPVADTVSAPAFDDMLQEKVDAFLLLDAEGRKAMIEQAHEAAKDGALHAGFRDWTQEQIARLAAKLEAIQSVPEATQDASETYRPKRERLAHEQAVSDSLRNKETMRSRLTAQIARASSLHGGRETLLRIHDNRTWKQYSAADFAKRYLELLERDLAYTEARRRLTGLEKAKRSLGGLFGRKAPEDAIMSENERREFKQMDDVVEELAIEKSTYRTVAPALREHTN